MAEKELKDVKKEEPKEEAGLDPKYLKGLTYRDAEERTIEAEGGIKKKKMYPREQELKLKHVLSWTDAGKELVIVSKDGRKHRVKK